jgi:hypothetical protein
MFANERNYVNKTPNLQAAAREMHAKAISTMRRERLCSVAH